MVPAASVGLLLIEGTPATDALEAAHDELFSSSVPTLVVWSAGLRSIIGPWLVQGESCCLLEVARLLSRLDDRTDDALPLSGSAAAPLSALEAVDNLAVAHVVAWLGGLDSLGPPGALLAWNWMSFSVDRMRVLKDPRCAYCGRLEAFPVSRGVGRP